MGWFEKDLLWLTSSNLLIGPTGGTVMKLTKINPHLHPGTGGGPPGRRRRYPSCCPPRSWRCPRRSSPPSVCKEWALWWGCERLSYHIGGQVRLWTNVERYKWDFFGGGPPRWSGHGWGGGSTRPPPRVSNDFIKALLLCLTLPSVTVIERQMLERTREWWICQQGKYTLDKILRWELRDSQRGDIQLRTSRHSQITHTSFCIFLFLFYSFMILTWNWQLVNFWINFYKREK